MFRRVVLTVSVIALSAGAAVSAQGPNANPVDLRRELLARVQDRDSARGQAIAAHQEVVALQAELGRLKDIQAPGGSIEDKRARLNALNAEDAALEAQIGRNRAQLAGVLGALELYRRDPPPALLVSPQSAKDAVRAAILVRAVTPELRRRAEGLSVQAQAVARARRAVAAASADLFISESSFADKRAELEHRIAARTADERALLAQAQGSDQAADGLMATLKARGQSLPAFGLVAAPSTLRPPVDGVVIRRFGQAAPSGSKSDGWTWRTAPGALVRAPAAGTVAYAGTVNGYGGVLILATGGGYLVVLAGLDGMAAAAGQAVPAGQTLGRMADRGVSQPELYFEIRKDDAPQDPARWIRLSQLAPAPVGAR